MSVPARMSKGQAPSPPAPVKDLPCGVYHLLLKTPGKTIARKIVKLE
jgi:hypothetical protein